MSSPGPGACDECGSTAAGADAGSGAVRGRGISQRAVGDTGVEADPISGRSDGVSVRVTVTGTMRNGS